LPVEKQNAGQPMAHQDKRNKRFYSLYDEGQSVLESLREEWRNINGAIEKLSEAPPAAERIEA
jgi:DNA-binding PadR family transcriptional regulator